MDAWIFKKRPGELEQTDLGACSIRNLRYMIKTNSRAWFRKKFWDFCSNNKTTLKTIKWLIRHHTDCASHNVIDVLRDRYPSSKWLARKYPAPAFRRSLLSHCEYGSIRAVMEANPSELNWMHIERAYRGGRRNLFRWLIVNRNIFCPFSVFQLCIENCDVPLVKWLMAKQQEMSLSLYRVTAVDSNSKELVKMAIGGDTNNSPRCGYLYRDGVAFAHWYLRLKRDSQVICSIWKDDLWGNFYSCEILKKTVVVY